MKQTVTQRVWQAAGLLTIVSPSLAQPAPPQGTTTVTVQQAWVANDSYSSPSASITALKVVTDAAGNVYTLSQVRSGKNNTGSIVTTKYSPNGGRLWSNAYTSGSPGGSNAADLAVDANGDVYVTGSSSDPKTYLTEYTTIKYATAGYQRWVSQYKATGNNFARAIALDASGNVYVTGFSSNDYATVKYNALGQQQWASRYDSGGLDTATDLAVDASGNVYVTGAAGSNYATLRYNASGQQQWVSGYDGGGTDAAVALALGTGGSVVVTGSSAGDYATVSYGATGQQQWVARYNGPANGPDAPTALAVDASGNAYVIGASAGTSSGADYATLQYNPNGQQQWVARYNSPENGSDQANGLALDAAGNVYVTGGAGGQYATLRYSTSGQQQWVIRYADTNNQYNAAGPASAKAIAVDAQANVLVTGNANTLYNLGNVATVKYVQQAVTTPPCNIFANQPHVPPHALSTAKNTPITVSISSLLSGATDPLGRPLTVASFVKPSVGSIKLSSDGLSYVYTPQAGYQGDVKLTYIVQENGPVLASSATRHYYEFVDAPGICWPAAQAAAAGRRYYGMQGYLATITYQGEEDFLKGRNKGQYYLGASDAAVEGEWRWTTGPEAGTLIWSGKANGYGRAYTNWQPGQPDDFQNKYRPQGEDYSLFYGQSGYWNDVDACGTGAKVTGYLVEYGGLEPCRAILFALGTLTVKVGGTAPAARPAAAALAEATFPTFEAFPNPSNGQFRVRLMAAQDGPAQLELFDMQGRLVRNLYSGSLVADETRELDVDATSLAAGLYQLRLVSSEGTRYLRLSVQP